QVRCSSPRPRNSAAVGQPFGNETVVFLPTLGCIPLAQIVVSAVQGDNSLARWFVTTIFGCPSGHAATSLPEIPVVYRVPRTFGPHHPKQMGTPNLSVRRDLLQAPRVGLEPTTNRLTGEPDNPPKSAENPDFYGILRMTRASCKRLRTR